MSPEEELGQLKAELSKWSLEIFDGGVPRLLRLGPRDSGERLCLRFDPLFYSGSNSERLQEAIKALGILIRVWNQTSTPKDAYPKTWVCSDGSVYVAGAPVPLDEFSVREEPPVKKP